MGIYVEKIGVGLEEHAYELEVYAQPAWRQWTWRALSAASWHGDKALHVADRVARRWHSRRCNGDCKIGPVSKRNPGDTEPVPLGASRAEREAWMAEHFTTTVQPYCYRMSLCAEVDLWLYHFQHADYRKLGRVPM